MTYNALKSIDLTNFVTVLIWLLVSCVCVPVTLVATNINSNINHAAVTAGVTQA